MTTLLDGARRLAPHRIHLFVLHDDHFLDPLVPQQWQRLRGAAEASAPATVRAASEILPSHLAELRPGIYFPAPLGRDLDRGAAFEELLERYHYDLIEVDDDGQWWWRGRRLAQRTHAFFLQHLAWEPAVERYFIEYRVHDHWWDKCYLDCRTTPVVARTLSCEGGEIRLELNTGQSDRADPGSFRLDGRERLLCSSERHGEVALSDWLRFRLLRGLSDDGRTLRLGAEGSGTEGEALTVVLNWPENAPDTRQPER